MQVLLVAGGSPENWPELQNSYDCYVGIDRGAWYLLQNNFPLDLAIGDFDSLSVDEKKQVEQATNELIQAPAEKMIQIRSWGCVKPLNDIQKQQSRSLAQLVVDWITCLLTFGCR